MSYMTQGLPLENQNLNSVVAYTVVLTSCGRFDLLRETVKSFLDHADVAPQNFIVIEDSGDEAIHGALEGLDAPFQVIVNNPQIGQMKAIDKAYADVTTPYVFHCEDDWEFFRSGFIAESHALLEALPNASMVGLRPRAELNPLIRDLPGTSLSGVGYWALDPTLHPEYFSYSFNPGLRRLVDLQQFMPLADVGHEEDVSYVFKKAGFHMVNLEHPAVRHIGDDRHIDDPTRPKRAKDPWSKLKRSIRKRIKRWQRDD